ncbi:hypothetical protein ACI09C_004429 [Cronobacter turicensis]
MQLVHKYTRRLKRKLTDSEAEAVENVFGFGVRLSAPEETHRIALQVFWEAHNEDLWLQCSCNAPHCPELTPVHNTEFNSLYFRNINRDAEHSNICPLKGHKSDGIERTESGARKKAALKKISYASLLPRDSRLAKPAEEPGEDDDEKRPLRSRKRIPRLARLLLSLIGDAQLHVLSLPFDYPAKTSKLKARLNQLQTVLDTTQFMRGHYLSEVITLKPWMTDRQIDAMMRNLEDAQWLAGRERQLWMIFTSEKVTDEAAVFSVQFKGDDHPKEYEFKPTKRFKINGEAGAGRRPPYWVIVRFERNKLTQKVECRDGYAHAMFDPSYPVPVDSELERETLRTINYTAEWVNKKKIEGFSMHVEKPVCDQEVTDPLSNEKGYVLPDFLITAQQEQHPDRIIVVETMGSTDAEYVARKAEQHHLMKQIGELITDPLNWQRESKITFDRCLFKYLLPPSYRK